MSKLPKFVLATLLVVGFYLLLVNNDASQPQVFRGALSSLVPCCDSYFNSIPKLQI